MLGLQIQTDPKVSSSILAVNQIPKKKEQDVRKKCVALSHVR